MRLRLQERERRAGILDRPEVCGVATFRTCLRDVTFLDDHTSPGGAPVLEEGHAYTRLLEIVCGLRSPMPGETQVQGQFKVFLDSLEGPSLQWLKRLGQQVLSDARLIREHHLRGLGSRTYGSAVRRDTRQCARVAILGAGALAREIHDYVADDRAVDVWTRACIQHALMQATTTPVSLDHAALVIAAPVDSLSISTVARLYPALQLIIDLRAADEVTALPSGVPVRTLTSIFDEHDRSDAYATKLNAALAAAAASGRRYDTREELHPFGWEDLCA